VTEIYQEMLAVEPAALGPLDPQLVQSVITTWDKVGIFAPNSQEFVGAFLFDENRYYHIVIVPQWRSKWHFRTTCEKFFELAFERFPVLQALIPQQGYPVSHHFVKLMGLPRVYAGRDGVLYALSKSAWQAKSQVMNPHPNP
jgi:hypothetical protein